MNFSNFNFLYLLSFFTIGIKTTLFLIPFILCKSNNGGIRYYIYYAINIIIPGVMTMLASDCFFCL